MCVNMCLPVDMCLFRRCVHVCMCVSVRSCSVHMYSVSLWSKVICAYTCCMFVYVYIVRVNDPGYTLHVLLCICCCVAATTG